ncbi:glycosyl transferase [Mycobacterium antarcticum]|uniref:glycosyltransferase n=1 Tax=Mycolicibacterium sp. TUM20985 TaxID=3023370 RepID=UPI00257278E9|nr:glycosyltransferase [Mycolicibacterium sp. TUM20985]BDX34335.1 glycosyl transferase [Mycolicibacterium sp. TUM20985]
MTTAPLPVFDHLLHMSDRRGTFEHALLTEPERGGGYTTDDMSRLLVVATRQPDPGGVINGLAGLAVRFLNEAQSYAGTCRNHMDANGRWTDQPTLEEWWGRCLWALGTAAAHSSVGLVRRVCVIQFERAAQVRSPLPSAMAYAAVGAAEILSVEPDHAIARALLTAYADSVPAPSADTEWPWPETQLCQANAVVAEAMIAAGTALERPELSRRGLDLLGWLLDYEATGERPAFDRQPVEVAAMSDACARAATVDASPAWPDGVRAAVAWFEGANAGGQPMWDPETGAGFDALHAEGIDRNQGAASTLAVLSTLQNARRFSTVSE